MTHSRNARWFGLLASVSLIPAMAAPAGAQPRATLAQPAPVRQQGEPVERAQVQIGLQTGLRIDHRRFTLPNGLTVLVYSDRSVPSVYVGVRYRTGAKDEPEGRSGFAHLFEHLMFQSTGNRKGGYLEALQAVGASQINGQTTADWTDYHQTVPTGALDFALWMESDRMANLADGITQAELDEQRGVVKNEKRQGEAQPGAAVADRFLASYYPAGHPYAHSVIGSMADLDRATLADVKAWFHDYYGAANAVLVVAGDIDFDTARDKVTRYFGAVRPGRAIDRVDQWLPAFADIRRETVYDSVEAATITRSWPVSNEAPREKTLLQLAAKTMAGSAASPLARALVDEAKVALGIGARLDEQQLGSVFTLSMAVRPGVTPEAAGAALDAAMAGFLARGPDPQRLQAVIASSDMALLRLMEAAPSVGGWMVASEVDHGDPVYFLRQRDWIGAATAADVRAVAAKWLGRPYHELRLLPIPPLRAAAQDVDRSQPPKVAADVAAIPFPVIHEARLSNGLRIVVAERPQLPLVEARLQFATGSARDPLYAPGAARQALTMMGEGTQTLDRAALVARLAAIGSGLSVDVGAQRSALGWSATTAHLDTAFALAADAVRHPRYPQEAVARLNAAGARQAAALPRNPGSAADALFARAIWGEQAAGEAAGAATLDRAMLVRFHDAELGPKDATLYLVGAITPERARALAERYFGSWQPQRPGPVVPPPATQAQGARIILVDAPGAQQASITVGHPVGPYSPETAMTEMLVDAVLGGSFDSRLNGNLRGRKGWTYGISGGIGDTDRWGEGGPRLFSVRAGVQTDKAAASMAEIRDEIRAIATARPVLASELDRERTASIRSVAGSFSGNAAYLRAIVAADAQGQPRDRATTLVDRLNAVTLADARACAARTYRADALTWVVVGDLRRIEAEIRALGIAPVEVWDVTGRRLR